MSSDGTKFDVSTLDPSLVGTHTFTLRASVVNPDTTEIENLDFTFTVEILPPDCAKAVLTCPTIQLTHGAFLPD